MVRVFLSFSFLFRNQDLTEGQNSLDLCMRVLYVCMCVSVLCAPSLLGLPVHLLVQPRHIDEEHAVAESSVVEIAPSPARTHLYRK